MGPNTVGRPRLSALGMANEDDNEVADQMGEDEDKEMRWTDSGDLWSAVKTAYAKAQDQSSESDDRGSESSSESILSATSSSESDIPGANDCGLPAAIGHLYEDW